MMPNQSNRKTNFYALVSLIIALLFVPFALATDGTAPVTTAGAAGTLGNNQWFTSDSLVTLECSDEGSGCATLNYAINGISQTPLGWGGSFSRDITISGTGTTLTAQHLLLTVDTASRIAAGRMQNDCSDIRFKNANGNSLHYWIEDNTCNTQNTRIWVKLDVPAQGTTITWAYGDSTALGFTSDWVSTIPPYVDSLSTSNAGFSGRRGQSAAVYNNRIYVFAGGTNTIKKKDTWYYDGNSGNTWTQGPDLPFASGQSRYYGGAVTFNNKIYLMGGSLTLNDGTQTNDVFSFDGNSWSSVSSASWTKRSQLATVATDSQVFVIGGRDISGTVLRDVWSSTDPANNGWSQVTANAGFSARYGHSAVMFNGAIYVLGGQDASGNYLNDVWRSGSGSTWTQQTASAPWSGRSNFGVVVYDNKIWVIGGHGKDTAGNDVDFSDVWYSSDGQTWTQFTSTPTWTARHSQNVVQYGNYIYLTSGVGAAGTQYNNDVYRLFRTYPPLQTTGGNLERDNTQNHVTVDLEGLITFTYASTDISGSQETTHTIPQPFKIDKTKPITSDNTPSTWVNPATLTLTCSDPISGCASITYCISNADVSCTPGTTITGGSTTVVDSQFNCADGSECMKKVTYHSADNAGWVENDHSTGTIMIDKKAPVTVDNANLAWQKATSYTVHLACTDSGIGCDYIKYCSNPTGGSCDPVKDNAPNSANKDVTVSCLQGSDCHITVSYAGVDKLGNVEQTHTVTILLDTKAPTNTPSLSTLTTETGIQVSITNDVVDGTGSGKGATPYRYYDSSQSPLTDWTSSILQSFPYSDFNSQHCFTANFRDSVDNQGALTSPSSCKFTFAFNPNLNVVTKATGQVKITLDDSNNNPAVTKYDMFLVKDGGDGTQLFVKSDGTISATGQHYTETKANWNTHDTNGFIVRGADPNAKYFFHPRGINQDNNPHGDGSSIAVVTLANHPTQEVLKACRKNLPCL